MARPKKSESESVVAPVVVNRNGNGKESRQEVFLRLAEARTSGAIDRIRQLRNLATASYEYTPEQVTGMLAAIRHELEITEKRFTAPELSKKGAMRKPLSFQF